ncbi:MAG TPA: hypothetical protein VE955_01040 [Candidatus Dormibacteraeota bacterium]|nr:hypothetical protein [Candidatus Dormibacteraeota bacterium]
MEEVVCYRCGRKMRLIQRLGIFFCDNDGYVMSFKDATTNGLVRTENVPSRPNH